MRNILSTVLLLSATVSFSQIIEPNKVPEVLPPAPTVAAFMKFEEIPVGYYTGIPDLSVPIFSTKLKNGQSLDVKLGYHPESIIANEVASNCGLGWSLFAGGTISRTVKGFPDEIVRTGGQGGAKIGIYSTTGDYINHFYEYTNLVENNLIDLSNEEMVNEYLWDVNVRGRYDTQHDLYQYNFMGYTGRFYIKKVNGVLEVVKLDKNALKISNNYDSASYEPNSFTVIDEYGNSYLFDVTENSTFSTPQYFYTYISAFHLKEIHDVNNILVAQFKYTEGGAPEINILSTLNFNFDKNNVIPGYNTTYGGYSNYNPLPRDEFNFTQTSTATRRMARITIPGQCYVDFDFQLGSSDSSLIQFNSSYRLNSIKIENWNHIQYKKFDLNHIYSNDILADGSSRRRLLLQKINIYDRDNLFVSDYTFEYKKPQSYDLLGRDAWGYFNKAECDHQNLESTPGYSDIDILSKIKYPEGGCAIFDYETNTYSYEGDTLVDNFDANPLNWQMISQETKHFEPSQIVNSLNVYAPIALNFSTQTQYLDVNPHLTVDDDYNSNMTLSLFKNGQLDRTLMCPNGCSDCKIRVVLNGNNNYDLRFLNMSGPPITLDVDLKYIQKVTQVKQYLFGGGNRIHKISYFDADIDLDVHGQGQKEINYDYSFFDNNLKSSGALAYPKPLFVYDKVKRECPRPEHNAIGASFDIEYAVTTLTNNLAAIKTKGADVGYKNVTVYEINNGFKRFVFTNATDFPEILSYENLNAPFLPTLNIDYKRGQLLEERIFDQQGNELKSTINKYSYEDYVVTTGINIFNPHGYEFNNPRGHVYYYQYKNYLDNNTSSCFCCFGTPRQFTDTAIHKEAYGWVKLDNTVTDEFFKDPSNGNWLSVHSVKSYTYNPDNLKVAVESSTDAKEGLLTTAYFYPKDASMASKPFINDLVLRNAIGSPIVVKKYRSVSLPYTASDQLFEKETEYGSFSSVTSGFSLILPKSIYTKKGNGTSSPIKEITFDYDTVGNMVEYKREGGTPTSIIWGYDKTLPIAKIENLPYATLQSSTIINLQTASNLLNNEINLRTALNILRTNYYKSMVTTLTYIPLVGVSSITDPKGMLSTYHYDGFNRLKAVKDDEQNILAENKYNYRIQN